jgi:hypothetical protein
MFDIKKIIELLKDYFDKQEILKKQEMALRIIVPTYLVNYKDCGGREAALDACKCDYEKIMRLVNHVTKSS